MKKCIKTNLYAAVDKMAVATVILLVIAIVGKSETLGKCVWGSLAITGLLGFIQMILGKTNIENKSGETIYTKSEEDCDATELLPGNSRYDIDGVKIKKTVYKVCDGCHAVVHEDGSVKVKSVTGKIINSVCGGGDMDIECWYNLFKA